MWILTREGIETIRIGSAEYRILQNLSDRRKQMVDLKMELGAQTVKQGWAHAIKLKWISYDRGTDSVSPLVNISDANDEYYLLLTKFYQENSLLTNNEFHMLERQKLIAAI